VTRGYADDTDYLLRRDATSLAHPPSVSGASVEEVKSICVIGIDVSFDKRHGFGANLRFEAITFGGENSDLTLVMFGSAKIAINECNLVLLHNSPRFSDLCEQCQKSRHIWSWDSWEEDRLCT
jgi:hypothetical protein